MVHGVAVFSDLCGSAGAQKNAPVRRIRREGFSLSGGRRGQIPVVLEIGAGRDHLVFEMEFSCEKGRLRIGNGVFEVWESVPSPYAEQFRSLRQTDDKFSGPTCYFANMVKDTVACVKEPGRPPRSSAADGLRVIEYLNSIKAWR